MADAPSGIEPGDEPDISATLGDLERQVFEAVRQRGTASVKDVVDTLAERQRPLAYTTVMTVLTRLWEKGYLMRRRRGKAYLYETRDSGEIAGVLGGRAVREVLERYGDLALTGLVRSLTPERRALVARLIEDSSPEASPTNEAER